MKASHGRSKTTVNKRAFLHAVYLCSTVSRKTELKPIWFPDMSKTRQPVHPRNTIFKKTKCAYAMFWVNVSRNTQHHMKNQLQLERVQELASRERSCSVHAAVLRDHLRQLVGAHAAGESGSATPTTRIFRRSTSVSARRGPPVFSCMPIRTLLSVSKRQKKTNKHVAPHGIVLLSFLQRPPKKTCEFTTRESLQ